MRPTGIYIEHIEYGSRDHLISWIGSVDKTIGGIQYYEVWSRIDDGEWILFETTENENISIERPIGHSLSIKVRAVDVSFHYSDFSDKVQTQNLPPVPEIMIISDLISGAPLELTVPRILDPDGCIIRYSWYIDGKFQSDMKDLRITLHEGRYTITLRAMDDQYVQGITSKVIEIVSIDEPSPNTSLKDWLEITSDRNILMPEVNITHYDNRSIIIQRNDTSDENPVSKEVLMDLLLLFVGVPLMITLVFAVLFLLIIEVFNLKGYMKARKNNIGARNGKDIDKEMILNNFLLNPNVNKILNYRPAKKSKSLYPTKDQRSTKTNQQSKDSGSFKTSQTSVKSSSSKYKGLGSLIPNGFRSAPSIRDLDNQDTNDFNTVWDEDMGDDLEEWEEVEL
jgi:hypothetical protein